MENIDASTMIMYKSIPFKEMRLKSGKVILAVTKTAVDKIKKYTYECGYITTEGKCSNCSHEILLSDKNGIKIDEEKIKFCWNCGCEIV